MRVAPVTRDAVFQLALATLAPVVPLALTMMSLEDLVKKLFGILL
jgi:threonine/homoserine efflux transporter RhtA